MTWKQFKTALNSWFGRLVALGFGGVFFAVGVAIFVHACHGPGLEFLVLGAFSLPFITAGAFVLILGIFGRPVPPSTGDSDGESMPSQSAVKGSLKNLSPEGKAEGMVMLLGYAWALFCAVILFKCLRGMVSANAPAMPSWLWCVPFSALPVAWWIHHRSQFYKRWGRCTLQLDAPAGVGKPFSGAVEAGARLRPTQDFHFTLLCEEYESGDGPSWWERSRAEQVVSRDRMQDNGPHSTIPFAFETLSLGSRPPLRGHEGYRWRLVFRTQLEGQSYEESFTGNLTVKSE